MLHTNSDSGKREKEAVTFAICVRTIWYDRDAAKFQDSGYGRDKLLAPAIISYCGGMAVFSPSCVGIHSFYLSYPSLLI